MAAALLDAYQTGTQEAMDRHYRHTWHRRAWQAMRTYVQLDLGRRPSAADDQVTITLDDARYLIAIEQGFASWDALKAFTESRSANTRLASKPVRLVGREASDDSRTIASSRDWNTIVRLLAEHSPAHLSAEGEMTDAVLDEVSRVETIAGLNLGGSKSLTDAGMRHLARLPGLKHLDLSSTAITDRGLEVLPSLPALETISLAGTHVTDAGLAQLAHCDELRQVNLSWTRTGDGALKALAGKQHLHEFSSGIGLTDDGILLLHTLPVFKSWLGGKVQMGLLSPHCRPNRLSLSGAIGDRGIQHMRGLDGLFGLNLSDRVAMTAAALGSLVSLPNLGWLSAEVKDDWMPHIADMPRLRYLGAQDTTADDEAFVALSALANMPALRALSVSCLNVDDAGVSALPTFPALKELMPMDVPDAGYRHIGRCAQLESLVLMYCRETTDLATEHITSLPHLSYYFNSYTRITDRTPELLFGMGSLQRITFDTCHDLTNAGIARLARLPALRELSISGKRITPAVKDAFPPRVRVHCPQ
jgi:hypothetical protein